MRLDFQALQYLYAGIILACFGAVAVIYLVNSPSVTVQSVTALSFVANVSLIAVVSLMAGYFLLKGAVLHLRGARKRSS